MSSSSTKPPLRILFLHGYTQTAPLFRAKTAALVKHLSKSIPTHTIHASYPEGPHVLDPADIPGFVAPDPDAPQQDAKAWWRRRDLLHGERKVGDIREGPGVKEGEFEVVYEGLEEGLEVVAECVRREGPFDGVVGFSQGGCFAGIVASLLEEGRKEAFDVNGGGREFGFPSSFIGLKQDCGQGPLKFCVVYSGFKAPGSRYAGFYEPKLRTRVLSVLGALDTVVDEKRSRELIGVCEGGEENVVIHPGGHFVPSGRNWMDAVAGFVKGAVVGETGQGGKEEESVEDMDVPF